MKILNNKKLQIKDCRLRASAVFLSFGLIITLALAGCGTSKNGSSNNSNGVITIASDTGATNQFIKAFNGSDVNVSAQSLFFEEMYDYQIDGTQVPRLASGPEKLTYKPFTKQELEKYNKDLAKDVEQREKNGDFSSNAMKQDYIKMKKKYVAKGKEIHTFPIRKGITWSDGVPFTAKDVAFSFANQWVDYCDDLWSCYMNKPPKAINDTTFQVVLNKTAPEQVWDLAIAPMHIIKKEAPKKIVTMKNGAVVKGLYDIDKWRATDPVGTGPGKLLSFTPQKIRIGWRSDYWGGDSSGVKEIDFVPAGSAARVQSDMTKGATDWAQSYVNDVQTVFVNKSKDNHYQYFPNGNSRAIKFNTKLAPVNDVAVRRALINSVDLTIAQKAVNIGYEIPTITGVAADSRWENFIASEYRKPLEPNIEQAKKYLEDAGWSINSKGNLEKDGKEYPLTLYTSTTEKSEDQIIMPIIQKEWETNLGLKVKLVPTGDTPFQAGKNDNKFQMFTDNSFGVNLAKIEPFSDFAWEIIMLGWNKTNLNIAAIGSDAIDDIRMTSRSDKKRIYELAQIASKAVVQGAPFLPYEDLGTGVMWSTKHWTNWPNAKSSYIPLISKYDGGQYNFVAVLKQLKPA